MSQWLGTAAGAVCSILSTFAFTWTAPLINLGFCHLTLKLRILLKFCSSYLEMRGNSGMLSWFQSMVQEQWPHGAVPGCSSHTQDKEEEDCFAQLHVVSPQTICLLYSPCERRMPAHVHWFINRVGNRNPSLLSFPVRNLSLQYAF